VGGLEDADWFLRKPPFGRLGTHAHDGRDVVVMELAAEPAEIERAGWDQLRAAWQRLPPHPNVLELIYTAGDGAWLRYAAIDWDRSLPYERARVQAIVVTRVFEHLMAHVSEHEWVWFLRPFWFFDLRGAIRIGWLPVSKQWRGLPREVRQVWPRSSERSLVHVVGSMLAAIVSRSQLAPEVSTGAAWRRLLNRATAELPASRIKRIAHLREALIEVGVEEVSVEPDPAWQAIEDGIGWLAVDRRSDALSCFATALELGTGSRLAAQGLAHADVGQAPNERDRACALEAERSFPEAVEAYHRARHAMSELDYLLAVGRCALADARGVSPSHDALRVASTAVARALAREPTNPEALELSISIAITRERIAEARDACVRLAEVARGVAIERLAEVVELALARGLIADARWCCDVLASLTGSSHPRGSPSNIAEALCAIVPRRGVAAMGAVVEDLLRRGEHEAAGALAEALIEVAPESAIAHYRHGRCLFALRRLADARARLDHACHLDPTLVEAMLIRREVDRAIAKVRGEVGEPLPQPELPAHLPEVKVAMAAGNVDKAIELLASADPGDLDARLFLAHLLVGRGRLDDALVAYRAAAAGERQHVARIGMARVLAELGRVEEASRLLDRVCAEAPRLVEATAERRRLEVALSGLPK